MKKINKLAVAAVSATFVLMSSGVASAGSTNPSANTANLEFGEVLRIRLPYGLCEFEKAVPAYVVDNLSTRRDWKKLVTYMLTNCPELGLPLADTATATISETVVDESGDGSGTGTGGGSGGTDEAGGTGGSDDDDDGNNGHGNDADHHDESNPGRS